MATIDERRAYIKKLLDNHQEVDIKAIVKLFNSSYPAVTNDICVIQTGTPYYTKDVTTTENTRVRRLGIDGTVTREEWVAICARHENKCAHCHDDLPLTMDHIVPLSKGGRHCAENIQPLCKSCNSKKGNRIK